MKNNSTCIRTHNTIANRRHIHIRAKQNKNRMKKKNITYIRRKHLHAYQTKYQIQIKTTQIILHTKINQPADEQKNHMHMKTIITCIRHNIGLHTKNNAICI